MNNRHLLSLLQENYHTVKVMFSETPTKLYTYKALKVDDIKVGDRCIVDSPRGLVIVEVKESHATAEIDLDAPATYKWIVSKVDLSRYDGLMQQQKEFDEAMRDIERLKQKEKMIGEMQRTMDLPEGSAARVMFEAIANKFKLSLPSNDIEDTHTDDTLVIAWRNTKTSGDAQTWAMLPEGERQLWRSDYKVWASRVGSGTAAPIQG